MMGTTELKLYKMTNTKDGVGGFSEAIDAGLTVWGSVVLDEARILLNAQRVENVVTDDQIEVVETGAFYRVQRRITNLNSHWQQYAMERIDRPINPVPVP